MKQDSIDYRDTYFFSNNNGKTNKKDYPSIDREPDISTVIKPNPYKTNVEIEKDEIVLKPDFSALHKAGGKKHSQGGTPVYLDENSFVFSDDKGLSLTPQDHKLFELKEGGNIKDNTPARVLGRNIDIKHYNTMVSIINDPKKDKLAKDTASAMLEKYMQTVGNIAYIQEQKKEFPQGIPEFAQNTAPVYDTDLKNEIMEQKQYMKYGGNVANPYLPKAALGMTYTPDPINPYTGGHRKTPTGQPNAFNRGPEYLKQWASVIPGIDKMANKDAQSAIYDRIMGSADGQKRIGDMWKKYGLTAEGMNNPELAKMTHNGVFDANHQFTPDELNKLKGAYTDGMFGARQLDNQWQNINIPIKDKIDYEHDRPNIPAAAPDPSLKPGQVIGKGQNGIPIDWNFTPWQKQSQLYELGKWANVNREMPYRSHFNATYMDPALVNPEQAVNDMKSSAYHTMEGMDLYNPIMANAQKAAAYGDLLDKTPGIRSQYDNQNVGIMNQTRAQNNQIKNNETMTNMQNDQQYWQQAATGRQNFKNMRDFTSDQYMNNRMQDVQDNQSLAYNMMALGPKPAYGFDWNTGNFLRNDKNIMDVQNNTSQNAIDAMTGEAQKMYHAGMPAEVISALIKSRAFSTMAPYMSPYPSYGQVMNGQMMNGMGNMNGMGSGRRFKKGGKNPYR